jgi:hypothetical protein
MEINTKNSSGMMNGLPKESKEDKKVGPIVGALIIVLILIITALFFFGKRLNTQSTNTPISNEQSSIQNTPIRNEANLSSSTEVQDLQADLDAQIKDIDFSF